MNAETPQKSAFCATQLPWHNHPFRLISWLEMNNFSAQSFYEIGTRLGRIGQVLSLTATGQIIFPEITPDFIVSRLEFFAQECRKISLIQSAKLADRSLTKLREPGMSLPELQTAIDGLRDLIQSEMEEHLFLWVPPEHAEWYSKDAQAIIGSDCCVRFPSIAAEVEEAAKCYALERYTACVFHLSRATEAGVKAVGIALGQKKDHEIIERTLKFVEEQTKVNPPNQILVWRTHGAFFSLIAGDARAIARAWRNKVCHLVEVYTEERAKEILDISRVFFRHVATKMDEKGTLY